MGREAAITYEQVAAAAEIMKAAGHKPTSRGLRERLGNVGSMGTINKLLQTWKAGQERQLPGALALPAPLQRAILEFMGQELASAKAALEAELAEQQQEAADLAAENERQAAEMEDRNETVTALHAERSTVQGRLVQLQAELATVHDGASQAREAAEAARIELAKALLRLEAMPRLEADLAALRADLETAQQGRVAAEQQAAVLAARLEAATARAAKAEAETADATAQARDSRAALAQETSRAAKADTTIATLHGKLDALQERLQQQTSELQTLRQEAKKAGEAAAERRGKQAGGAEGKPSRKGAG